MASLMETIIDVLVKEEEAYRLLIELSKKKTPIIIKNDLDGLARITEEEQNVVSEIQKFEKLRMQTMKDIADVTNHTGQELKLPDLIDMMSSRPSEQGQLREIHDKLKVTLDNMKRINEQNRELLQNSIDMVNFEINLLQAARRAPETADYDRGAYSTGSIMGSGTKTFDSKS